MVGGIVRVGTLVRHYAVAEGSDVCLGIIIKVHDLLDYYGHKRVDVYWLNLGIPPTTTESIKVLREVK
tara:strand:+ start:878 stop:1081 length:204 start_codon:yes stop_codon:yes gene_type:complete